MAVRFEKMSISKFVLMLFGVFAFLVAGAVIAELSDSTGYSIYFIQILFYVVMFIAYYYFGLTAAERRTMLDGGTEKNSPVLAFLPFFVGGLVSVLYVLMLETWFPGLYESYMEASQMMEGISLFSNPLELFLIFLSVVVMAPIVEEIVFRGILFNLLNRRKSTLFAMVVSSLIFGLLHAQTMVPTAIIGFVLCFIYHRTGSIRLVMTGHMVNNLIAFSLPLFLGDADVTGMGYNVFGGVLVLMYIVFAVYFIRYFLRNRDYLKLDGPMYRSGGEVEARDLLAPLHDQLKIIDISRPLEDGMKVFEGDPEVIIREVSTISESGYSVRSIQMNTHASTHMDFPSHFIQDGHSQDHMELSRYFGEVMVVENFQELLPKGTKRVIAREGYLDVDRASALVAGGIRLIGTVNESVEPEYPYEVHKILLEHDIIILENLDMSQVERGKYTLSAFPLKIKGAEAAPVRAVLIDDLRRGSET